MFVFKYLKSSLSTNLVISDIVIWISVLIIKIEYSKKWELNFHSHSQNWEWAEPFPNPFTDLQKSFPLTLEKLGKTLTLLYCYSEFQWLAWMKCLTVGNSRWIEWVVFESSEVNWPDVENDWLDSDSAFFYIFLNIF